MAHQSPMISIPKKTTEEVDWTTPIRNVIAQSYGESPDNYATECASLQRCRQDAVRGAGSDMTARDLLYKYFGQLELLELRFSEIRVSFPWHDAFTNKLITQTSIAYEKASILFQIASTHSAIAASQNRSDPEGLKRAFYYFRTCAGMLTYINENFLHAPSTDLSREVVKFLVNTILAQATEVFFEKCTDEKKGAALVSKVGAQTASMYASLTEEVKEFMGKGIFDRNWVTILQIKSKYFSSLTHYYRGLADNAAGKHGDALVRFIQAESHAKEASRTAATFGSLFVTNMSPNLPPDAGSSIQERTKAHLAICSEKKAEAQRENDLIYNAILPSVDALPTVDKLTVATPIPIQEVYGAPDVQKVIGPDLFVRLIPLSVHESASVYSEEKAKLVRGEVEKAEGAEGEVRSALDSLGVKAGLVRFRAMAEGELGGGEDIPMDVRRWKEDISLVEDREGVEGLMAELQRKKESVQQDLETISRTLEVESRDCEMMRVKYGHQWSQAPSAGFSKSLRQDLKSHFTALEAAAASDQQVSALWDSVRYDIRLLLSDDIEDVFRASTERENKAEESLLDLDVNSEADEVTERAKIGHMVSQIDERLSRLSKISRERGEVLKDLKDKIQTDDVSHLLLLNRRNTGVEPALFANELEKFRPYQQRLDATAVHQQETLQEVAQLWKVLKDSAGRGPGAKKWDEREKRKKDTVRRFSRARDVYMEIRDGLAKGLQFYSELTDLTNNLRNNVQAFTKSRTSERDTLVAQLETEKRLSAAASPPPKPAVPPPPPSRPTDLSASLASMRLSQSTPPQPLSPPSARTYSPHPQQPPSHPYPSPNQHPSFSPPAPTQHSFSPAPQQPYASNPASRYQTPPQPPQPPQRPQSQFSLPPPPPPPQSSYRPSQPRSDPYAALSMFDQPSAASAPAPPSQYQQPSNAYTQRPQYPPASSSQSGNTQNYYQQQAQQSHQSTPPIPPPPPSNPYGYGQTMSPTYQQPGHYPPYNQQQGYGQR